MAIEVGIQKEIVEPPVWKNYSPRKANQESLFQVIHRYLGWRLLAPSSPCAPGMLALFSYRAPPLPFGNRQGQLVLLQVESIHRKHTLCREGHGTLTTQCMLS